MENEVAAKVRLKGRREFSDDAKRTKDDVEGIGRAADRAGRRAAGGSRGFITLGKRMGHGLRIAAGIGVTSLGLIGAAAGAASFKMVGLASDAEETQSKFSTVFAGIEAPVASFIETTNRDFGIPTKELQDAASTFGVFAKAADVPKGELADFSTSLTQAGLDLASFYNVEPGEALLSLRSGLAGEAEPLRKFGIFLSDASMKAKAAQMGLTGELNESQKVMVRQKLILEGLGDAQGDLARTQGSLSNQTKALKGRFKEAATEVGRGMVPLATKLVGVLNRQMKPAIAWLQVNAAPMGEKFAAGLERAWNSAAGLMREFKTGGLAGVATMLQDGADGGLNLQMAMGKAAEVAGDLGTIWRDLLQPAWADAQAVLPFVVSPLALIDDVLGFIADNARILGPLITGLTTSFLAYKTMTIATKSAQAAYNAVLLVTRARTLGVAGATASMAGANKAAAIGTAGLSKAMLFLAANPVVLVIAAVVGLAVVAVMLYKRFQFVRDLVSEAGAVLGRFGARVYDVGAGIVTFFTGLPGKISRAAKGMWDGIKDAFRGMINWIIRAWNGLDFTMPSFEAFGKTVGGFTVGVPDMKELAQGGGTRTSGVVSVGERGREWISLPPAAEVYPAQAGADPPRLESSALAPERPQLIQLVVDRRVLAEVMVNGYEDMMARQ